MPIVLYLLESYHHNQWMPAFNSNELDKVKEQYNLCKNMFPDGAYRIIQVLRCTEWDKLPAVE